MSERSETKSRRQKHFEEKRTQYTDRDIQMEILYRTNLISKVSDQTRVNTNVIKVILIITVILSILSAALMSQSM